MYSLLTVQSQNAMVYKACRLQVNLILTVLEILGHSWMHSVVHQINCAGVYYIIDT